MHEFADALNLGGIILEIIGFGLLLGRLRTWLRRKYAKALSELEKEGKGAPLGASDEIIDSATSKTWKKIEVIGIPLVMTGLFFQGLSLIFHVE